MCDILTKDIMNTIQYKGGIESWDGKCISGWAYCQSSPDENLTLDIVIKMVKNQS